MVGALVLVMRVIRAGASHPAYWILTTLYVFGAVLFSDLMFFSPGIRNR